MHGLIGSSAACNVHCALQVDAIALSCLYACPENVSGLGLKECFPVAIDLIMRFLRFFAVDPVNLSLKGKIYSLIACFCSIFFIALITRIVTLGPEYPMIVASMGASTVILFFIPNSPLAQPWPFASGQLSSALVGITCALYIEETASAAAVAVGGSVLVMLLLRCLHPPGAATSLAPIMAGESLTSLGYNFVIQPVAVNVVFMLLLAVFINRLVMKHNYPSPLPKAKPRRNKDIVSAPSHKIGISEEDLNLALQDLDFFVDMTHSDLSKILTQTELNTFKRIRGDIRCADIMIRDVITVDYGTEVEDAWRILYKQNLKAMPVTDRSGRVIGIGHDFFKFIDLDVYGSLQNRIRSFIRRTAALTTSKQQAGGRRTDHDIAQCGIAGDGAHCGIDSVDVDPWSSADSHCRRGQSPGGDGLSGESACGAVQCVIGGADRYGAGLNLILVGGECAECRQVTGVQGNSVVRGKSGCHAPWRDVTGFAPSLDDGDFFGLQSFGAIGDLELHFLAFIEGSEAVVGAQDVSEMYENIGALFLFDKTETFVRVEPFDDAGRYCRHNRVL